MLEGLLGDFVEGETQGLFEVILPASFEVSYTFS